MGESVVTFVPHFGHFSVNNARSELSTMTEQ
jgi:hypothetical protein